MNIRSALRTRITGLLIAGLVILTGCTSRAAQTPASTSTESWTTVSIDHALGKATITKKPQRIVTLGMGSAETAIALGTVPVGVEEYPWGSDETGYLPWIYEEITKQGKELPAQFKGGTEIDIEKILKLEPDLILAPWSGITQEQYDLLKDIAPTVAYNKTPWVTTWQEQINVIALALGMPDKGKELIKDVNDMLTSRAHKKYEGLTFSYIYNTGPGSLGVFFDGEQRVAMAKAMGLTLDPAMEELHKEHEREDHASIGLENADKLAKSDLIFTFYSNKENRAEIEAQPLYQQIPAIARGSVVAPTDQALVTASSIVGPLTVPWVIERFEPLIDQAVEKLK
ncbi:iron-siderophore ABC transporter substrate-binding protein [Trueperella pyogenes]|uniref:iron-siderophore ABC transporter substrate-binding protein n=1 Tax=Trueperella pyogenes TaxID=1661 RepID=UPI00345DD691